MKINLHIVVFLYIIIVTNLAEYSNANIEHVQANVILNLASDFIEKSFLNDISNGLPVTTMSYAQTLDGSM